LIYKGRILKDDQTLQSYGINPIFWWFLYFFVDNSILFVLRCGSTFVLFNLYFYVIIDKNKDMFMCFLFYLSDCFCFWCYDFIIYVLFGFLWVLILSHFYLHLYGLTLTIT
jgi:hypothetical protein